MHLLPPGSIPGRSTTRGGFMILFPTRAPHLCGRTGPERSADLLICRPGVCRGSGCGGRARRGEKPRNKFAREVLRV